MRTRAEIEEKINSHAKGFQEGMGTLEAQLLMDLAEILLDIRDLLSSKREQKEKPKVCPTCGGNKKIFNGYEEVNHKLTPIYIPCPECSLSIDQSFASLS